MGGFEDAVAQDDSEASGDAPALAANAADYAVGGAAMFDVVQSAE